MPSNDQHNKRKRHERTPSPNPMEEILRRLCALEDHQPRASVETQAIATNSAAPSRELPNTTPSTSVLVVPTPLHELASAQVGTHPLHSSTTTRTINKESTQSEDVVTHAAERLLTAINCAQTVCVLTETDDDDAEQPLKSEVVAGPSSSSC